MKIIKEIEKSRLKEITGGAGVGENCSKDVTYRSCSSLDGQTFQVRECAIKLSCPSLYYVCSGPEPENYHTCTTPTQTNHSTRN